MKAFEAETWREAGRDEGKRERERNSVGRWDETASTTMESVFSVELYRDERLKTRNTETAHGVG